MRRQHRQISRWLAPVLGFGVILTGCGTPASAPGTSVAETPAATPPATAAVPLPPAQENGKHLVDAEEFVKEVGPYGTLYVRGGGKIIWPMIKGGPMCRTDCSGFLNELLEHSLGYGEADFSAWFGVARPLAKDWYAAITANRGFVRITRVEDLRAGDFLAIRFPPGGDVTGHCMLVAGTPKKREATAPLQAGLMQWEVAVIDASKTPHGEGDTRHLALKPLPPPDPAEIRQVDTTIEPVQGPPPGSAPVDASGLGRGTLRLYSDENGQLAGYAWSLAAESKFKPNSDYPLAGGRWIEGFDPKKAPLAAVKTEPTTGD